MELALIIGYSPNSHLIGYEGRDNEANASESRVSLSMLHRYRHRETPGHAYALPVATRTFYTFFPFCRPVPGLLQAMIDTSMVAHSQFEPTAWFDYHCSGNSPTFANSQSISLVARVAASLLLAVVIRRYFVPSHCV